MLRIGIIGPSEIALRRFLPALNQLDDFEFTGVAIANKNEWKNANDDIISAERIKAEEFIKLYGGKIFEGYANIIHCEDIDAIYLPLPPALHYQWSREVLLAGKHLFVEKPATTLLSDTKDLIETATKKNLAIHENYMFKFHEQLNSINKIVQDQAIGDIRLIRISFGFPRRAANDFRYNKTLGGGALLDCGGYTLKYASMLLGETTKIKYAQSNYIDEFDVDISGSAALTNIEGVTAQIAFGMDNTYKCDLEIWGSKGFLSSNRVLTAPAGFIPEVKIQTQNQTETIQLPADDAFRKSLVHFRNCVNNNTVRTENYSEILRQAQLVHEFLEKANN